MLVQSRGTLYQTGHGQSPPFLSLLPPPSHSSKLSSPYRHVEGVHERARPSSRIRRQRVCRAHGARTGRLLPFTIYSFHLCARSPGPWYTLLAYGPRPTSSALSCNRQPFAVIWAHRARRLEQGHIQRRLDDVYGVARSARRTCINVSFDLIQSVT